MIAAARETVIEVARTWVGTPFHDHAGVKGVGVDCAHLLERVYAEAGVMDALPIEHYPPDWHLHRGEERFVAHVLRRGREIAEADVGPGDMVLFRFARCYSHGAIVVAWPAAEKVETDARIIHAWKGGQRVLETGLREIGLEARGARFFSLW